MDRRKKASWSKQEMKRVESNELRAISTSVVNLSLHKKLKLIADDTEEVLKKEVLCFKPTYRVYPLHDMLRERDIILP